MKHEIERWIEDAAINAGFLVERLPAAVAADIILKARSQFVSGNPRIWWMSLACKSEQFDSTKYELADILPERVGKCWLIPETESEDLPVYSIDLSQLPELLEECPYFEYYVLGSDFGWLVLESDHNVYFVCRMEKAKDR